VVFPVKRRKGSAEAGPESVSKKTKAPGYRSEIYLLSSTYIITVSSSEKGIVLNAFRVKK
jgi:hypothetical protein